MTNTTCTYDLKDLPSGPIICFDYNAAEMECPIGPIKWSRSSPPPPIGARIHSTINGLGTGTVISYFIEHEWLGVIVKLDNDPDWHRKQAQGDKYAGHALLFGCETRAPKPTTHPPE